MPKKFRDFWETGLRSSFLGKAFREQGCKCFMKKRNLISSFYLVVLSADLPTHNSTVNLTIILSLLINKQQGIWRNFVSQDRKKIGGTRRNFVFWLFSLINAQSFLFSTGGQVCKRFLLDFIGYFIKQRQRLRYDKVTNTNAIGWKLQRVQFVQHVQYSVCTCDTP